MTRRTTPVHRVMSARWLAVSVQGARCQIGQGRFLGGRACLLRRDIVIGRARKAAEALCGF
jgi:hypothetical protein